MAYTVQDPSGEAAKAFGAYYTDATVADFLVRWAVRAPADTVLDPSFGGGVFLRAALQRLLQLGGNPRNQIFGIEIDPAVHVQTQKVLAEQGGICPSNLICSDFFEVSPGRIPAPTAVVGNPPFIRYQRFSGEGRARALAKAASEGVVLSQLSSSWAPFLVHSVALLSKDGRLGMVIPTELLHAAYARPLLEYLADRFERITLVTFRERLFPHLSQDTLLLLAEGKGSRASHFHLLDLAAPSDLEKLEPGRCQTQPIEAQELASGRTRTIEYLIPHNARALYQELSHSPLTTRLGALADVGIGYVTGNNLFFHLSPGQVAEWGIPPQYLKPAVRRARGLKGLRFSERDWQEALSTGEAGYLLHISSHEDLPDGLRRYLAHGESRGVHQAYKCRVRDPWYSVPQVYLPDAFLTYMSGNYPRLVTNDARAVAPNSLHVLRLRSTQLRAGSLAGLWQTSLTRLSTEIEGHAMGGGMLKLEPGEAEKVVLVAPGLPPESLEALSQELDSLVRAGRIEAAQNLADEVVLVQGLRLTRAEIGLLRSATKALQERRYPR
ncbi:N-6 DNA methylase [Meiothermus sp.]|uniref:N-6 DNA methylase n=1 Tax=Meiothermus sp. TaxID=1955249 RepID=UPI00307FA479